MKTTPSRSLFSYTGVAGLLLAMALLNGCQSNKDKAPITPLGEATDQTTDTEPADSESLPGMDADKLFFQKVDGLSPIYFGFDSSSLDTPALADVRAASDLLKTDPKAIVQIEGHADERGTQEYNLALGERRAQSVRNHLRTLGVSGDRIVTISYGEEMPAVSGSNEAAWAKNRRCEFSKAQIQ